MKNSILEQLLIEPGRLSFKEVRYIMIRPEVIAGLQQAIETEVGPEKCANIMLAAGSVGGSKSSQRFKEVFGYSEPEIVEFMCRMGAEIGWGFFRLEHLDLGRNRMVIEVTDSPFAAAYGPAQSGICHLIRGVVAGMAAGIFGGPIASRETACAAKGDTHCRFEVQRED